MNYFVNKKGRRKSRTFKNNYDNKGTVPLTMNNRTLAALQMFGLSHLNSFMLLILEIQEELHASMGRQNKCPRITNQMIKFN